MKNKFLLKRETQKKIGKKKRNISTDMLTELIIYSRSFLFYFGENHKQFKRVNKFNIEKL